MPQKNLKRPPTKSSTKIKSAAPPKKSTKKSKGY